jgi:hypothetical protein
MAEKDETLDVVARVASEIEASLIVQHLAGFDIEARAIGGFTAGFRAEAPGTVAVLVKHCDLARAQGALAEVHGG